MKKKLTDVFLLYHFVGTDIYWGGEERIVASQANIFALLNDQ